MKNKILSKISGITLSWLKNFVLVFSVLAFSIMILFSVVVRNYYYNTATVSLKSLESNIVTNYFSSYLNTTDEIFINGAKKFTNDFAEKNKIEVWVIDGQGRPVSSSSGFNVSDDPVMPDYSAVFSDGKRSEIWKGKNEYGEKVMAITYPIDVNQNGEFNSKAAVRYIVSLEDIDSQLGTVYMYLLLGTLLFIFTVILSGKFFIKSIVVPMEKISKTVHEVADGDYNARVIYDGEDEINDLCENINAMLVQISDMDKMKNDFISTISHEIRTPLTAVKGWGETLSQIGDKDPVMLQKGLNVIISESTRLSGLVEELLDFSRIQNGALKLKNEIMDVLAELDETVFVFRDRAVREGIDFVYSAPEYPAPMMGDPNRIKQVYTNILDNALKYTEQGGKVSVNAEIDSDNNLIISVSDTGCGIAPEDLPKVKEKFYKTSINYRGSGIGLAVADEIVKLHNGELKISSVLNQGTTVKILLPLEKPKQNNSEKGNNSDE